MDTYILILFSRIRLSIIKWQFDVITFKQMMFNSETNDGYLIIIN